MTIPYTDDDDTPAEAEERYWVGDGQSDNKVYERGRAHIYAETYLTLDASRIARLLNLDAKYEDQGGIEAEVERLKDKELAPEPVAGATEGRSGRPSMMWTTGCTSTR